MEIFDNITKVVRDDLKEKIQPKSKVSIAAACFSMYAYKELKSQLEKVDEFRFIFTSPTFIKEKAEKQKREFYIPRLSRENSLYGTEFEIKLRNEMTQKAIARECADWIRKKATFKSNVTGENMGGFMTVESPTEQTAYMPINGFTTVDIGCERGNNSYNMVNSLEAPFSTQYMQLFETLWNDKDKMQDVTEMIISIGKLVDETGLTRKAIIAILQGIQPFVFDQFKDNPEEFITKAAQLINDQKATAIIEHITYDVLDEQYGTDIFTDPTIKGKLGVNAMKAKKHLYDHIVYDSTNERDFATDLDTNTDVAVYVKLPDGFYISTPVGHYNPDWAIAFYEGSVKHIYFVAETKGSMNSMQLRLIEESKIHCAREHFKAISNGNVVYDVVDSYKSLMEKVMK